MIENVLKKVMITFLDFADISPKQKNLLRPSLTTRCQKFENWSLQMNSKLLTNLRSWKLAYLISQLRTGFPQKLFRLKTCHQGAIQAQEEKSGFWIFTTSNFVCLREKQPLNSYKLIFAIEYQWPLLNYVY